MSTYRIFFRSASRIVGRHDFLAPDAQAAVTIADILCDACSDRCDTFEVWSGDRCILGPTPRSPRAAEVILGGRSQDVLIECEEAIQLSDWPIASSERLLKRLEELRASSPPRARSEA